MNILKKIKCAIGDELYCNLYNDCLQVAFRFRDYATYYSYISNVVNTYIQFNTPEYHAVSIVELVVKLAPRCKKEIELATLFYCYENTGGLVWFF